MIEYIGVIIPCCLLSIFISKPIIYITVLSWYYRQNYLRKANEDGKLYSLIHAGPRRLVLIERLKQVQHCNAACDEFEKVQ